MGDHENEPGDEIEAIPLGDKKSHLFSMLFGVAIGAFVSATIVLGTAVSMID